MDNTLRIVRKPVTTAKEYTSFVSFARGTLTIVNVILLSFNSEELNHYTAKVSLMNLTTRKHVLMHLPQSID
jgi:hypothetical protein